MPYLNSSCCADVTKTVHALCEVGRRERRLLFNTSLFESNLEQMMSLWKCFLSLQSTLEQNPKITTHLVLDVSRHA